MKSTSIHPASATGECLLDVRDLTIWRGENLLIEELSFSIKSGTVVQIQGTNGTGKTTVLRALIGLAAYDEGQIYWRGKPARKVREDMHSALLYLGHKSGISAGLTPMENLLALCPELAANAREEILDVLEELAIDDRIDLPSAALSAGQQRRVSLARMRLQQADLWVLDEPLTSLDVNGYQWVRREIQAHAGAGGAVVFTTHQPLSFDSVPLETVLLGAEQ
ncbi:MAG: cytochrome c biogenesis heme-transporting ATPase CcmA [Granulosicoccus sp.]